MGCVCVCNPSAGLMGAETDGFPQDSLASQDVLIMRSRPMGDLVSKKQGGWKEPVELHPRLSSCLKKTHAHALSHEHKHVHKNKQKKPYYLR